MNVMNLVDFMKPELILVRPKHGVGAKSGCKGWEMRGISGLWVGGSGVYMGHTLIMGGVYG